MRLFLFGQVGDGAKHLHGAEIDCQARSVRDLVKWLGQREPELAAAVARPGVRFAVDQKFAGLETAITPQSEVAMMSPLSGG